jgi:hypothetical protein
MADNRRLYRIPASGLLIIFLLFTLIRCSEDDGGTGPNGNNPSGPVFLVGCNGSGDSVQAGLYRMTNAAAGPSFEFITPYYPQYLGMDNVDMNNGRIAIRVQPSVVPEGKSGVMFMDVNSLASIQWVPVPDAPEDYYFDIANARPAVLPDGRIAYPVTLQTDNKYDDAHWGMIAVYNPSTGDVETSGNPSDFVLAQPEQGSDTEGGSLSGALIASPDGRYIYSQVYGYGTEAGAYHVDYKFIVRYTVGQPGSYERIVQSSNRPTAITSDGSTLILTGDGLHRVDVGAKSDVKFDDYANVFYTGQVAKSATRMFKIWRGSGLGEFTIGSGNVDWMQIVEGKELAGRYQGLGHGAQYSAGEDKIYFTASTDYYTNYKTDLRVFSTPIQERITEADSVTTMPVFYCTKFFLLLND